MFNKNKFSFSDFKDLPDYYKEQVGLSVMSFFLTKDDEFFLAHKISCSCCYPNRESVFWILDRDGNVIRKETEEFYLDNIKSVKERYSFEIPKELTKNYMKINI